MIALAEMLEERAVFVFSPMVHRAPATNWPPLLGQYGSARATGWELQVGPPSNDRVSLVQLGTSKIDNLKTDFAKLDTSDSEIRSDVDDQDEWEELNDERLLGVVSEMDNKLQDPDWLPEHLRKKAEICANKRQRLRDPGLMPIPLQVNPRECNYRYQETPKNSFGEAKKAAKHFLNACPLKGLTGEAAAWAVQKQKQHHSIILRS
ncbi:hypothetical protein P692DRAFT_20821678 [Suillus brevipes Sb2]|nr:hypothetical protein P692DRAFT_20821678 [Suillus brevipes Sb2]